MASGLHSPKAGIRLKPQPRGDQFKRQLQARLNRAEGQLRGLKRMLEHHGYCIDVLQQISAVRGALDKLALMLVRDHLATCVADALSDKAAGAATRERKIEELVEALARFLA